MSDLDNRVFQGTQVLSTAEKEANKKQWYKDKIQMLDMGNNRSTYNSNGVSEYHRMKVNYDLFNNILDLKDFEYVIQPFGNEVGELPAKMVNRDILSNKIKVILGLESTRPFEYRVVATNSEATTRKEEKEYGMIKDFVINSIMTPIKQQLEMQAQQEMQGKELTPDQQQQIQQQVAQQLETMTPEEVKVYMERDHQDISEILSQQLLDYLLLKEGAIRKFNQGTKHAALAAKEFYWVGEVNGEPALRVCNPRRCNYDKSPETEFVEDGEWFSYEYRMTPSQVIAFFADELTKEDIQAIYTDYKSYLTRPLTEDLFSFSQYSYNEEDRNTMRVLHVTWRALREIKFLKYKDENGEEQETIVSESYVLNKDAGDISITVKYLPEIYEGYKIGSNLFKKLRPVPGQFKDMDNLYNAKLPYYGTVYDSDNSIPTSIMDRGKVWQYYLNIVYYRLEMVLASDKGKKVMMNINSIPDSVGIDVQKFQYFFETSPFGWFNPNEEGVGYSDVNTIAKVIDLSTASDIAKYVELADKIKRECGEAMGISPQMEAQIAQRDAVQNTKQALVQNSLMLEPFFSLHDIVKRNTLMGLIECAKVCYAKSKPRKLSYVLDDMTIKAFDLEPTLLENSTLGIFINNATETQRIKDTIVQLSNVAMQNQQATFKDVLSVLKETSIAGSENILEKAKKDAEKRADDVLKQQQENQKELENIKEANAQKAHEREKEIVVLKEEEKRKTVVIQMGLTGASFNPDQDKNQNGENDFIEIARKGLETDIKERHQNLEERKFEHQKSTKDKELSLKQQEIQLKKQQQNSKTSSSQ